MKIVIGVAKVLFVGILFLLSTTILRRPVRGHLPHHGFIAVRHRKCARERAVGDHRHPRALPGRLFGA